MILADVPMEQYVRDTMPGGKPSLSSHVAHLLLSRSPLHAWTAHPPLNPAWEMANDSRFDLGSAAHAVLLEGKGDLIAVCDFADWRMKAARAARDDARAAGKLPLLADQALAVAQMAAEARKAYERCPDLDGYGIADLLAERTVIWQDGAAWLRCRPDWISSDGRLIVSYKTTNASAEPDAFTRTLIGSGYDLQAAFELSGVKNVLMDIAVTGSSPDALDDITPKYVWLVQETTPPYACSLLGLSPDLADLAASKYRAAVKAWTECVSTGRWPGYPDRICWVEPPPWERARWEGRAYVEPPAAVIDDGRPLADQLFGEVR